MRKKEEIISEIDFCPIIPKNGVIAFVSFTYKKQLRITDCALMTRPSGGYRLSYPLRNLMNGKTVNSVYPINKEIAQEIEILVYKLYEDFLFKNSKDR